MLGAAVAGRAAQRAASGGGRRMWFVVPALLLAGAVVLYLRAWIAEERILRRWRAGPYLFTHVKHRQGEI